MVNNASIRNSYFSPMLKISTHFYNHVFEYRWVVVCLVVMCCVTATFLRGFDSIELALHGDMVLREEEVDSSPTTDKKD